MSLKRRCLYAGLKVFGSVVKVWVRWLALTIVLVAAIGAPIRAGDKRTPSDRVLAHVLTASVCCNNSYHGDPVAVSTRVARNLSWSSGPNSTDMQALSALGVKGYAYTDPSLINDGNNSGHDWTKLNNIYRTAIAQKCQGQGPVYYVRSSPGSQFALTDPRQSATLSLANEITTYLYENGAGSSYSAVFFDDIGAWGPLGHGLPCNATNLGLYQSWATLMSQVAARGRTPKIIINALAGQTSHHVGTNANWSDPLAALNARNVIGGMAEGTMSDGYSGDDTVPCDPSSDSNCNWSVWQDLHIRTTAANKFEWYDVTDSGDSTAQRIYDFASFMLAWSPNYSVYQTHFATTGTTLKVTPETGLTAYNPLVGQPRSDIGSLREGNVYVREYRNCYYRAGSIGGCAFVVNATSRNQNIPRLSQSYSHSVVVDSNLVLENGTIHYTGAVPTQLGPRSATILVQGRS